MDGNILGYYRKLRSLRYGNEYCVEDAVWEKLIFSSSTEAFSHVHWFVQCYKTNQWLGSVIERAYGYAARHSPPKWPGSQAI